MDSLGVEVEVVSPPTENPSVIFVGNHISYVDIPLLMSVAKDLSFVAKSDIRYWPLIGRGARILDTVFVNRNSKDQRHVVRDSLKKALQNGKRVTVFPSGTTKMDESIEWKKGAFEIAQQTGALIQPFRLTYSPLRQVAYIDDDFLPTHLGRLMKTRSQARIEFHPPVPVTDPIADSQKWRAWTQEWVSNK